MSRSKSGGSGGSLEHWKIILALALLLIFYNEFLIYWISMSHFPALHVVDDAKSSGPQRNHRPLRFLLVADPQLIGENDEPWYYDWLARWDSDRYLRGTFAVASSYVQPDVIVYLGDLFDEGLAANDAQFKRYYERFTRAFRCGKQDRHVRQIYVSGDNDIGGEYYNDRTDYLADRFESYFGPLVDSIDISSHNLELIKLDLDYTVSFYNSIKRSQLDAAWPQGGIFEHVDSPTLKRPSSNNKFRILLNHMTLLYKTKHELNALNEDIGASLILKGDSHKFSITTYDYEKGRIVDIVDRRRQASNLYVLQLKRAVHSRGNDNAANKMKTIYELSVPTCSYRMGVPDMGYGMMTLTSDGKVHISVLWSHSRFDSIYYYLIFLLIVVVYVSVRLVAFRFSKFVYRKIASFVPSLNRWDT